MNARSLALAGLLTCAGMDPAGAGFINGNQIYSHCQRQDQQFVDGYVAGIFDQSTNAYDVVSIFTMYGSEAERKKLNVALILTEIRGYCSPQGVTLGQVTDVFCGYLRDTPAERHEPATALFSKALGRAWPCKKP